MSERRACEALGLGRSTSRYRSVADGQAALIKDKIEGSGIGTGELWLQATTHPFAAGRLEGES